MSGAIDMPPALRARVERVCEGAAGPQADDVDRAARFPAEAVEALRRERLLGVAIPRELGGEAATLGELSAICARLSEACASTAMIFAMHQIKV